MRLEGVSAESFKRAAAEVKTSIEAPEGDRTDRKFLYLTKDGIRAMSKREAKGKGISKSHRLTAKMIGQLAHKFADSVSHRGTFSEIAGMAKALAPKSRFFGRRVDRETKKLFHEILNMKPPTHDPKTTLALAKLDALFSQANQARIAGTEEATLPKDVAAILSTLNLPEGVTTSPTDLAKKMLTNMQSADFKATNETLVKAAAIRIQEGQTLPTSESPPLRSNARFSEGAIRDAVVRACIDQVVVGQVVDDSGKSLLSAIQEREISPESAATEILNRIHQGELSSLRLEDQNKVQQYRTSVPEDFDPKIESDLQAFFHSILPKEEELRSSSIVTEEKEGESTTQTDLSSEIRKAMGKDEFLKEQINDVIRIKDQINNPGRVVLEALNDAGPKTLGPALSALVKEWNHARSGGLGKGAEVEAKVAKIIKQMNVMR